MTPLPVSVPSPGRSAHTLAEKVRPYRGRLAQGAVLLLVTQAAEKAVPWLFRVGIDGLGVGDSTAVIGSACAVVALAAVAWFVRTASRIQIFNVGRDVEFDLRNQLLARLHVLGPSYLGQRSTGELMSRATNDLAQVRLLVGFAGLNVVNSLLAFVASIALMLAISPWLTLVSLVPFPFIALAAAGFSRLLYKKSVAAQGAIGKLAERVQEDVAGMRAVRTLGLEDRERARFDVASDAAVSTTMGLVTTRALMWPVLMGLSSVGTLVAIWRGALMVVGGEISVGELAAFTAYLGQLVWPTLAFGYLLAVVQRGRAGYERVREILVTEPPIAEPKPAKPAPREGAIAVRDLSYTIGDRKILDDVSFEAPAGSFVAIVGTTGSGKSVLASLLARLQPTPPNAVFLDGVDVTTISIASLRRTVGVAPQEPFLFSTTVRANLALALDQPDGPDADARIEHAAREAAVEDEIEAMPEKMSTVVGERGVQLSGGQKQRIALARALLASPRVLVLDDPMSAVDARTEAHIISALERAAEGRTLVLVTHRVAAAARADSIVVLDAGKVVERGTHKELLAAEGLYARLAARQRLESELAALASGEDDAVALPTKPAPTLGSVAP